MVNPLPLLLLLLLILEISSAVPVLDKVTVLHRHGARTPMGIVNGALECQAPYCQLTNNGQDMCRSLGRYINNTAQYPLKLGFPAVYNVSFMHSEATEYARVVVSGEAMVMGIFEGQEPLPFVDYLPKTQDTKLVMWDSWPTWILRSAWEEEVHADDAAVVALVGAANLTTLGEYFQIQDMCATAPTNCVGYVQDYIACNISANLPVATFLLENWPIYKRVQYMFLTRIAGYRPTSSDYSFQVGSLGYEYVQGAMNFFTSVLPASDPSSLMKLRHTAAHDITLFTVFTALGIWTEGDLGTTDPTAISRFITSFAETLILESYVDASANNQSYVKALWGRPNQSPPNFDYTFSVAAMKCITPNGTSYRSDGTPYGCPIEDLQRFVQTTAPASPLGICYSTDKMLKAQNCMSDDAPPAGSRCLFYRQNCPMVDCGKTTGAIADPAAGYACQSNQLNKGTQYFTATVIALVAPSLLAGAIMGFYGADRIRSRVWGSANGEKASLTQQI